MLRRHLVRLTFVLLLAFAAWVQAATPFSRVYVFGDSLSDTGNFGAVVGDLPFPFYMNRISNGPAAVDILAARLGHSAEASIHLLGLNAGTNYAVAGANAFGDDLEDLGLQISGFLINHGYIAPPDALYVMFIGGNDVRSARGTPNKKEAKLIIRSAAAEVRQAIETLAQAGARSFLLVNAPSIGALPETRLIADASDDPGLVKRSRKLTSLYRKELHKVSKQLADDAINIVEFDLFKFFNKLIKKADKQGFTNATDGCFSRSTGFHPDCNFGANFDQFVFFDEIHPTARVHAIVGDALFEALDK